MGHRDDVWAGAIFRDTLFDGIAAWAVRNVDADVTPNIEKSCSPLPRIAAAFKANATAQRKSPSRNDAASYHRLFKIDVAAEMHGQTPFRRASRL